MNPIVDLLSQLIAGAIGQDDMNGKVYNIIKATPNPVYGDLALSLHLLKKIFTISPEIEQRVIKSLETCSLVDKVCVVNSNINIFLNANQVARVLMPIINTQQFFKPDFRIKPLKIMIEFSQPNTHKEIHVGHMRNMALGKSLSLLLTYIGHNVIKATYPGDIGTHVAKTLHYISKHNIKCDDKEEKGNFLGHMYSQASQHHSMIEKTGSEQDKLLYKAQLTEVLKQIEIPNSDYNLLWKETRQWSIDLMLKLYKWNNLTFDVWYFESDVNRSSIDLVNQLYEDNKLVKKNGAIGIELGPHIINNKKVDLKYCILLKSDGEGLYSTKDIDLAIKKFQQHKLDKSLYLVDVRQTFHFQQIFKTLQTLGYEFASKCEHLSYDFVTLPGGIISSRSGNSVPITMLIDSITDQILDKHLVKYKDQTCDHNYDLKEIARTISIGAINYGMLKTNSQKQIIFDVNEWIKLDGNSGPYLQYVYVRIKSIINKSNIEIDPNMELVYSESSEKHLIVKLSFFNDVVYKAATDYKPEVLCHYLYNICKDFNTFYGQCKVNNQTTIITNSRLSLCLSIRLVLEKGLELLGIPCPEVM